MEIDHSDLDDVARFGRAVLEVDLVGEDVAVVRRELEFVVIAEPMEARLACDLSNRRQ